MKRKPSSSRSQIPRPECSGLTLPELLVVLATLGFLSLLVLPALASPQSKAAECLNNMRQLAKAWIMYAGDNNERLATNGDPRSSEGEGYADGERSFVTGVLDWTTGSYNTNTSFLTNDKYSLLGGYCNRNPRIFACPSANFVSPPQRALGWGHRARSVAMNAAVGDGSKYEQPFPFGWTQWCVVTNLTGFQTPSPANVWVFIDEHPDSIDDQMMYVDPSATNTTGMLLELPANTHSGGCGVTFADGSAAIHKWQTLAFSQVPVTYTPLYDVPMQGNIDLPWLSLHTPRSP
jgi:prepilin-type processing-associated H-X9-DG protein